MNHKIITSAGFGNSGSSAATNFFEEFDNVKCIGSSNFECTFIHEPDGLMDLAIALKEGHRLKVDLAVKRFIRLSEKLQNDIYRNYFNGQFLNITKDYLKSLNLISWNGGWHRADEGTTRSYKDIIRQTAASECYAKKARKSSYGLYESDSWRPHYVKYTQQFFSDYSTTNSEFDKQFITKTKEYLNNLFDACDPDNKFEYLLFDQLLPPNATANYIQFFSFIKVVVIDRDPRDLYFANKVFWGNRFFPSDTAENFSNWYSQTRKCKLHNLNSGILHLYLEDFVFNYEATCKLVYTFTGLTSRKHTKKRTLLVPENSERNTRLWEKYTFTDIEYSDKMTADIKYIEKTCKNFCYANFPMEKPKTTKGISFIIGNAINDADYLITVNRFSFFQKVQFFITSVRHLFFRTNIIKACNWIKTSKLLSIKQKIFAICKIAIFLISLPFELIFILLKSLIDSIII